MSTRLRTLVGLVWLAAASLSLFAAPAGAQQLVDAGKENGGGGIAFVLFTVMVGLTVAVMFSMDRIRRRREQREQQERR